MSLRVCLKCSTVYAIGPQACPHCGAPTRYAKYDWEDDVAKAHAYGSSYYVPEGQPVPAELPPEVRLVGPGSPDEQAELKAEAEKAKAAAAKVKPEVKVKVATRK